MFKEINIKTKLDMGIIEELFNRFTRADQSKSGFVTKYDVEDVIRDVDNMKLNDQLKAKLKEEVNN